MPPYYIFLTLAYCILHTKRRFKKMQQKLTEIDLYPPEKCGCFFPLVLIEVWIYATIFLSGMFIMGTTANDRG